MVRSQARSRSNCCAGPVYPAEYCQPADSFSFDRLVEQFTAVQSRAAELRATMAERNEVLRQRLEHQFKILSDVLFSGRRR